MLPNPAHATAQEQKTTRNARRHMGLVRGSDHEVRATRAQAHRPGNACRAGTTWPGDACRANTTWPGRYSAARTASWTGAF
eukprot:4483230-Lingulodinium_polyedra.AAC.1